MIQQQSFMKVADNTGAKELMCIRVLGGTGRRYAASADVVVASGEEGSTGRRRQKGRSRKGCHRENGEQHPQTGRFICQGSTKTQPSSSRRQEPEGHSHLRAGGEGTERQGYIKILSLAPEVV